MLPLKRILVPTDFSEPAQEALKTAIEIAEHFSAQLLLVHVVPPVPVPYQPLVSPAPAFDITAYLEELTKISKETLQKHADKQVPQGIERTLSVSAGDPSSEILNLSQELEPDLIVIATHGRGGWQRFLFGSVAEKVVRQAPCPVLVVHAPKGEEKETATRIDS